MNIYKIINEEYARFLKEEYDENVYETFFEKEQTIKNNIFGDFLYKNNSDFTKHVYWKLIPYLRLKKIWEDYISKGFIRDEKGLNMIKGIMIANTIKVGIFTMLAGHTQESPDDDFEENIGYFIDDQLNCLFKPDKNDKNQLENPENPNKEKPEPHQEPCRTTVVPYIQRLFNENNELGRNELKELINDDLIGKFYDYYAGDKDNKLGGFVSDYGLKPLQKLLFQLMKTQESKEELVLIDRMLNVLHQRSDIASWFVEGGSNALSQLSGYETPDEESGGYDTKSVISGRYNMSDYN